MLQENMQKKEDFSSSSKESLLGQNSLENGETEQIEPTGRWYHAAFHTLTTVVGAGVLGLPWAFAYLSPLYAVLFLVGAMAFSLYTAYQLAYMHETNDGTRLNTYILLGQHVLGKTAGNWSIIPFQYAMLLGSAMTYIIMCGESISHIVSIIAEDNHWSIRISTEWGIVIFGATQLILAHVKDFHSLWSLSLAGSILAIGYSAIAGFLSIITIVHNANNQIQVSHGFSNIDAEDYYYNVLNAMGTIIFAFCAHSILLETQATLSKPPSTRTAMMKAVSVTYVLSLLFYAAVGVLGFIAFGSTVNGNILVSTREPKWLVMLANIMVVVHMVGANLLNYMPVFENIETSLKLQGVKLGTCKWAMKSVVRSVIVGITIIVALFVPFFSDFNGLVGSIAGAHMNFVMPPILWLLHHPVRGFERIINIILIILGTVVAVGALVGSARNLVVDAVDYHS